MAYKPSNMSVEEDTAYFKRMLDLIPPQSYFDAVTKEQLKTQNESTPTKGSTKEGERKRKHKNKEKKHRENPLYTKSVTELQEELANKESNPSQFTEIKAKKARLEPEPKGANPLTTVSLDLDDKRAKLRAKIEELQAKRKLNASDKAEKRRLKRKESKMKLKERRKALKQGKQHLNSDSSKPNANQNVNGPDKTPTKKFSTPSKPILNKEGQMVFSKFDFTDSNKKEKHKNEFKGKDYKRLLEKVEKRNEKINKVKSKDEAAGKVLQDKLKWRAAMDKAEGEKVKDDPELLKKALKRKEKMKAKTKKQWQDRGNTVKKLQDAKQEKRTKNIQVRKQAKKDNKLKKAKKKGRIIPGF